MPKYIYTKDDNGLWEKDGVRYRFDRVLGSPIGNLSVFLSGKSIPDVAEKNGFTPVIPAIESDAELDIPDKIMLWQFRAILKLNNLWDSALASVNEMPEPNRTIILEHLEHGQYVFRNSPTLDALRVQLDISIEQTNEMFQQASTFNL